MTIRLSSGMRDAVVSNFGIGALLSSGYIRVYTGVQPETADMAATGQRIGFITRESYNYEPPHANAAGCLQMMLSASVGAICNAYPWELRGRITGVPGWWRFCSTPEDPDDYSTARCRVDGSIEDGFSLFPPSLEAGWRYPLEGFLLTLPAQ